MPVSWSDGVAMGCCCSRDEKKGEFTATEENTQGRESKKDRSLKSRSVHAPRETEVTVAEETKPNYYVALWSYEAASRAEVNVKAGDRLRELEQVECDAGSGWVFATILGEDHFGTGYIPRAFVALEGSLEIERWYFGQISRPTADKILWPTVSGTYLVRSNPEDNKTIGRNSAPYVLSVKKSKRTNHYRINRLAPRYGDGYFLTKSKKFCSVVDLIEWYSRNKETSTQLLEPARKPIPNRIELLAAAQKKWLEVKRTQIDLGKEIGRGNFGIVYEGVWRPQNGSVPQRVAVKSLKRKSASNRNQFLQEAAMMKDLFHPRLVKLCGVICSTEPFWLITEFVKDGNLRHYLRAHHQNDRLLPESTLFAICTQIAEGMMYLEEKRVVHRDLAARNILVDVRDEHVIESKIADFGMAKVLSPSATALKAQKKYREIPVKWTAPEALRDSIYSTASDVWSFGILTHEVFTHGQDPYAIMSGGWVREYVVNKRLILTKHERIPDHVYEMMSKCFAYNPFERPTFKDVHQFFHRCETSKGKSRATSGGRAVQLPVTKIIGKTAKTIEKTAVVT